MEITRLPPSNEGQTFVLYSCLYTSIRRHSCPWGSTILNNHGRFCCQIWHPGRKNYPAGSGYSFSVWLLLDDLYSIYVFELYFDFPKHKKAGKLLHTNLILNCLCICLVLLGCFLWGGTITNFQGERKIDVHINMYNVACKWQMKWKCSPPVNGRRVDMHVLCLHVNDERDHPMHEERSKVFPRRHGLV